MNKLLVCTDLSESCVGVINYISNWVKGTDVIVDVVHVYDPTTVTFSSINIIKGPEIQEEMKRKMKSLLEKFISVVPKNNQGTIHLIADNNFSEAILQRAKEIEADLLVTGLRQKYTLLDRFFGSTTARLVDDSKIPLLTIPYERKYAPLRHIVFPTAITLREELTDSEEEALSWICENIDGESQRKMHLVHIEDGKQSVDMTFEHYPFSNMEFTRSFCRDIATGVINYLDAHETDLLAIYRPAKSAWEKIYKSSVAKKLLFQSHLPILFL